MIRSTIRVFTSALTCAHLSSPLLYLLALFSITLACAAAHAQADVKTSAQATAAISHPAPELDRQEVFRRIEIFEDFARRADSLHLNHQDLVKVYMNLGVLYDMAGMIPKATAATQRAVDLMKDGPQDQLAEEYNNLSALHVLMGDLRQAVKDQMQALAVREKIGDPLGVALTWTDMAGVYIQQRQYKKALEYAQKSFEVLADRTDMNPTNHIAVLQTMAFALCNTGQCGRGVQVMKRAVDETNTAFGSDSLSTAAQGFALGYLYWKNGNTSDAAEWMRRSLARMKVDLGWGAPLYVKSMEQYSLFLHKTGQREEAHNAESEIHRVESLVDARTMTTRGGEFLSGTR